MYIPTFDDMLAAHERIANTLLRAPRLRHTICCLGVQTLLKGKLNRRLPR